MTLELVNGGWKHNCATIAVLNEFFFARSSSGSRASKLEVGVSNRSALMNVANESGSSNRNDFS